MKNRLVPIREATAKQFLPAEMHKDGGIDLHALANVAGTALAGSQKSLDDAKEIVNGNWLTRWWNSNELQGHMIDSIGFLRDISKVNLGLSAICNDLAEANLEHARRIDTHTQSTNDQLAAVQASTSQILEHLRKPAKPALLDGLIPALTDGSLKDRDAIAGWLRTLTESINLEYEITLERVEKLQASIEPSSILAIRLEESLSSLADQIGTLRSNAEAIRVVFETRFTRIGQDVQTHFASLTKDIAENRSSAELRAQKLESMLKKSHDQLGDALKILNARMRAHQSESQAAIKTEADARVAMNHSLLKQLAARDEAFHKTIGHLNKHWLKRLMLVGGGLAAVQISMFIFLAFKAQVF
jgi:hypothetical protein